MREGTWRTMSDGIYGKTVDVWVRGLGGVVHFCGRVVRVGRRKHKLRVKGGVVFG